MRIGVFGTGYVGLVDGVCLAAMGNDVICADLDPSKIALLNQGKSPIFEPGLLEMIEENVSQKRLVFTTDLQYTIANSDILFICVGTPSRSDGSVNVEYVENVARSIGAYMNEEKIIITKSTVPVGSNPRLRAIIQTELQNRQVDIPFHMVSNPEFLREGSAVHDFMSPDRIVVGIEDNDAYAEDTMVKLYASLARADKPILFMDIASAELIKYASNAMLASRISFMNQLSQYCEKVGADITVVSRGMGFDDRIGPRFLQAGAGFGGSCFPKDLHALIDSLHKANAPAGIFEAILNANEDQKQWMIRKIEQKLGSDGNGRRVAIWGLSFKPKTDDIRDAPSITIVDWLVRHGFHVQAFDPEAMDNYRRIFPHITYGDEPYSVLNGAELLIMLTEWDAFRNPDWKEVLSLLKQPQILDCRNIYESYARELASLGFAYEGVGVRKQ